MSAPRGAPTGLGHRTHPLLGKTVLDAEHGGVSGILRAVAPEVITNPRIGAPQLTAKPGASLDDEPCVAWLAPEKGGREWCTPLDAIREA